MKIDKENFFKIVDSGYHLNSVTREAYWEYFIGTCEEDFIKLYKEGDELFPDSGIHAYITVSLDKKMNLQDGEKSDIIKPITSPSDKETAITWGRNFDVRGK